MNDPLKILSVNYSDSIGGASKAAYRIHCAVNALGADSKMFVKNKELIDESILELSDFHNTNISNRIYSYVQNKIKNKIQHYQWNKYPNRENVLLSDLRSVSLHGPLQKIDYDLLHLHWINFRFLDLNELRKINKPVVWTLHDCWLFTGGCHYFNECENYRDSCGNCPLLHSNSADDLSRRLWKQKNKILSSINIHIVTPSQWLADCVKNSSLLSRFPITVIPNCLDTEIYTPCEKKLTFKNRTDNGKKKILFGAMNATGDKRKGFDKLLESISILEKTEIADKLEFLVFGADKPINELQTKIPIRYLGYLTDEQYIVAAYNEADVMVVPSLWEVFGQTASEAMSCGVPTVAFNCSGIKEVIVHKKTGYLAKSYSIEDLAKGIIWCLENNINKTLSRNARKRVEDNYTPDKVGEKYLKLYKELS